MANDKTRKHWLEARFGLAWNTNIPRPNWIATATSVGITELVIDDYSLPVG
jgi:hypothetical protein